MKTMIRAEHVSIGYKIGDFKDIGLKEWTMRHLKRNYHVESFMAVNDVSFELKEGDMLGIIGANGAGKSTLLKAVIGVMEPREGHIERNGNVSALLELASGFDGDLTVKENAYLRGAMLGYTKEFMDATYGDIIAFAELEDFQDRPFKQLSTGMQSRLAFSIASLVQPEILILDEVLSVGDGAFQEKSAAKMRQIISGGAATVLVSHSLEQIRELCSKVLWLDRGRQIAFGSDVQGICDLYADFLEGKLRTEDVPAAYQRLLAERSEMLHGLTEQPQDESEGRLRTAVCAWDEQHGGSQRARIGSVAILDQRGRACDYLQTDAAYTIEISYALSAKLTEPYCGIAVFRDDGVHCYGTNTAIDHVAWEPGERGTVRFQMERCPLQQGRYVLDVAISEADGRDCDYFRSALEFEVVNPRNTVGLVAFSHKWVFG